MSQDSAIIVADIGGTNARFALVNGLGEGVLHSPKLSNIQTFRCDDYHCFEDCCQSYLQTIYPIQPSQAVLAVAGPVDGQHFQMTNRQWHFSVESLTRALNLHHLHVINDFLAQAYSLLSVSSQPLWEGDLGDQQKSPKVILGPGTGLGVSALIAVGERWQAVASEAGHNRMAAPSRLFQDVMSYWQPHYDYLSYEHFLSGSGIFRIYTALLEIEQTRRLPMTVAESEIEVSQLALRHDCPIAAKSVQLFFDLLAAFAGDMATSFSAKGGVYLSGGILPKIIPLLNPVSFRQQFRQKGAMSAFVASIPVNLITDDYSALLGCALFFKNSPSR